MSKKQIFKSIVIKLKKVYNHIAKPTMWDIYEDAVPVNPRIIPVTETQTGKTGSISTDDLLLLTAQNADGEEFQFILEGIPFAKLTKGMIVKMNGQRLTITNVNNDLQSFKAYVQNELTIIKADIGVLQVDVKALKQDVTVLKQDVAVLKQDVAVLKQDVTLLKQDVAVLKQDVTVLKQDVAVLKQDVTVLKQDVAILKQDMSEVKGNINKILEILEKSNKQ